MVSGMKGVRPYSTKILAAIIRLPMSMKGRNLPNLPFVRSISAPMSGSVTASHRRMAVTITEANRVPSVSTLAPKVAM